MIIANEINFLLAHGLLLSDNIFNIQNSDICFNMPLLNFCIAKTIFCGALLKTV